jgi:NhaP-type Na+/H+ or K+/H+ antiporter
VTTNQILIGIGLILVLAVGAQILASRLHIPAIIVLLPTGFIAGALTTDVNPDKLLGPAFEPLVSLSVAVILYDAGLGLDMRKLKGHVRKVVIRLIIIGVLVTWVLAASVAAPLLGMSRGAAVMLGIILVVSGPTVVGPLRLGELLGTTAQLAAVIAVAAGCDAARADTGLIAAIFMGLALANQPGFDLPARRPFLETLVQLIIGVLFISISATVTPQSLRHLVLPSLGLIAVLVIVARPLTAFASTLTGRGARLEEITAVLLLTDEDDFNALASVLLADCVEGRVYRLAPPQRSHGVVAPTPAGRSSSVTA